MSAANASAVEAGAADGGVLPWLSILGACLCFGTFAVPMKWPSVVEAQVHPLIYQGYKTFWIFITGHAVLFFQPYEFTWWGVASGFSWVPAGLAAVFAVQNAGIARAQAIWQVTLILASFFWGFVILRDSAVYSVLGTCLSLCCLITGVVGMTLAFNIKTPARGYKAVDVGDQDSAPSESDDMTAKAKSPSAPLPAQGSVTLGVGAAIFNGIWGSANLVPSHYTPYSGIHFTISFVTGALIANVVIFLAFLAVSSGSPPPLHLRVMALPGFISGGLWSLGNFCSLYAVSTLGQGIGYSLVQSSVIVSGLWGIFYYRELTGRATLYWFAACLVCMVGVLGLAREKA